MQVFGGSSLASVSDFRFRVAGSRFAECSKTEKKENYLKSIILLHKSTQVKRLLEKYGGLKQLYCLFLTRLLSL